MVFAAAIVMLGWAFRSKITAQLFTGLAPMPFMTAFLFALTGVYLVAASWLPRQNKRLLITCAVAIGVLAGVSLAESVTGRGLGVDLAFLHRWLLDESNRPGRMAPNVAVGFLALSACMLCMANVTTRVRGFAVQVFTYVCFLSGITGLVGYWFAPDVLFGWSHASKMAIPASAGMMAGALGMSLLWRRAAWFRSNQLFTEDQKIGFVAGAVIAVVTISAAFVGFAAQESLTESAMQDSLQSTLNVRANAFRDAVDQANSLAQSTASKPLILDSLNAALAAPSDVGAQARLIDAAEAVQSIAFDAVAILAADGHEVVRSGVFVAEPQMMMRAPTEANSQILWKDGVFLRTSIPLVAANGASFLIVFEQRVDKLQSLFFGESGLGKTGTVSFCSGTREGVMCFPNSANKSVFLAEASSTDTTRYPLQMALAGQTGTVTSIDWLGRNFIQAYGPVAPGIGIVVSQDATESYAPIRQKLLRILPIMAILVVVGALIMQSQIRPLTRRLASDHAILMEEKERLKATIKSMGEGVITTDALGNVKGINPVAEELTGWSEREAKGMPLSDIFQLVNDKTGDPAANPVEEVLKTFEESEQEAGTSLMHRDGRIIAIESSASPVKDSDTKRIIGAVLTMRDTTESRQRSEQQLFRANHDVLTGMFNRRAFEDKIGTMVDPVGKSKEANNALHALLFLDLDKFKRVNDTCGHQAGDELLRQVTTLLRQKLRGSDTIARLGGDEFAVLLENCSHLEPAVRVGESMRTEIENYEFAYEDQKFSIGVSIGLVMFKRGEFTQSELLRAADNAMYAAKRSGRNKLVRWTPQLAQVSNAEATVSPITRAVKALDTA
jgi:diguanylate cyclase (GGDEF)-like protein/PAS domain S-box-containing protein